MRIKTSLTCEHHRHITIHDHRKAGPYVASGRLGRVWVGEPVLIHLEGPRMGQHPLGGLHVYNHPLSFKISLSKRVNSSGRLVPFSFGWTRARPICAPTRLSVKFLANENSGFGRNKSTFLFFLSPAIFQFFPGPT